MLKAEEKKKNSVTDQLSSEWDPAPPLVSLGSAAAPTASARAMVGRLMKAVKRIVVVVTGMQVLCLQGTTILFENENEKKDF
jgi:hypothetical protein